MAETTSYKMPENPGGNNGRNSRGENPPQKPPYKDNDGNEITRRGKFWSGLFLILLTLFSALYLVAHWPDRLVAPRESIKPLYTYKWFKVRLVGIPDTGRIKYLNDSIIVAEEPGIVKMPLPRRDTIDIKKFTDSLKMDSAKKLTTTDSLKKIDSVKKLNDSIKKSWQEAEATRTQQSVSKKFPSESKLIHINTLLLILVAIAGFLGNMIYVATSFTTFIGNGQFKKSWTLWYFVKPFTASALALAIYFVFRGGFLNMSDDSTNINLYGLMTISILAGLFTDRTTLKLKEVFDVLLKPTEERANPLVGDKPEITGINAPPLEVGKAVSIVLNGKNLDKQSVVIKIEDEEIRNVSKQPDAITFDYSLPDALRDKDSVTLKILNDKGEAIVPIIELKVNRTGTVEPGGTTATQGNPQLAITANREKLMQDNPNIKKITPSYYREGNNRLPCVDIFTSENTKGALPDFLEYKDADGATVGVKTRVIINYGNVKPQVGRGHSIANDNTRAFTGTACCILEGDDPDRRYLLSCNHVMTAGRFEDGAKPNQNAVRLFFGDEFDEVGAWTFGKMNQTVDAAIIDIEKTERIEPNDIDSTIYNVTEDDCSQTEVELKGGISNTRRAFIIHIDQAVDIDYKNETISMNGLITLSTTLDHFNFTPVTRKGDSGALVYHANTRQPIGMVIGANTQFTFVTPIMTVLNAFPDLNLKLLNS